MFELDTLEKTMIVHQVIVDLWSHDQTASKFGVSVRIVQDLVSKARRNADFLTKLRDRDELKLIKAQIIDREMDKLQDQGTLITNSKIIQNSIHLSYDLKIP